MATDALSRMDAEIDLSGDGSEDAKAADVPQFRYAVVLSLVLATVIFLIAAPAKDWARAVAIAIEGSALVVSVATSRERRTVRRHRAILLGVGMIAVVLLVAFGVVSKGVMALVAIAITVAIPVALVRGLLRLMTQRGVTLHAVAGSLAIYLAIGLIFAWVVGFVAAVDHAQYFTAQASTNQGDKVYYSFTVLTTTGFGDYTPATPVGHAIAVIEMLTGQLYLVTVIGLLIGNFAARGRVE